jgi:4a-hydroxytetrahydrobiopterin dehydratase
MPLTEAEVDQRLGELDGWRREGNAIVREFRLGSFREAVAFIVRIAFEAEQRDHHPELSNVYNRVTIRLSTHDAGGVTEKDVELAKAIDGVL